MRTLYEDDYFQVAFDADAGLIRARRTATPYPAIVDAQKSFDGLEEVLGRQLLAGFAILVDSREAPGRNDSEFESMLLGRREALFRKFRKRAVLFHSVAGVLQSQRMGREARDGVHVEPFTDEAKALAYLKS